MAWYRDRVYVETVVYRKEREGVAIACSEPVRQTREIAVAANEAVV